jgi:hypothetical protein
MTALLSFPRAGERRSNMKRYFRESALLVAALGLLACETLERNERSGTAALYTYGCTEGTTCEPPSDGCYQLTGHDTPQALPPTICTTECTSDGECPGGRCVRLRQSALCFKTCATQDECSSGTCQDVTAGTQAGAPGYRVCWITP